MAERRLEERRVEQRVAGLSWPTLLGAWPALRTVIGIFLLSRLVFYAAALIGSWLLPQTRPWTENIADAGHPWALAVHWRWDGGHYYNIAVGGYEPSPAVTTERDQRELAAYFPMLPLLIRGAAILLGVGRPPTPLPIALGDPATLLAGALVGHATALLAFWLLYNLARLEGDEAIARRALLYTAFFPLGFFYAVPYTEALFLATSAGMFLAARRGHWLQAGLWCALATATRSTGALLIPALALEIGLAWRRGELHAWRRPVMGLLVTPLGILLFMLYLWLQRGDPLAFLHAQTHWERQWLFPLEAIWRGIDYVLHPERGPNLFAYNRNLLNLSIAVAFLAVLLASLRRWRPAYTLYTALYLTLILSSALPDELALQSVGRYLMVLFPVYLSLARWGEHLAVHQAIMLIWAPQLALLSALFANWFFIG